MTSFWERRRAAVAEEQRAEVQAESAAAQAAQEQALAEQSDEALLANAGFPEPEALESAEQLQAFLKEALPQRLKTRALRRLWRLNPVLANLDGLVDYGEDFTDAALVVENMQTVYQVGKGMFDKAAEAERRATELDKATVAAGDDPEDGQIPDDGTGGDGTVAGPPESIEPNDAPIPSVPQSEPELISVRPPVRPEVHAAHSRTAPMQPSQTLADLDSTVTTDPSPALTARRMRFRFET